MKKEQKNKPVFSLRLRLILLVAAELMASVLLAVWLGDVLDRYVLPQWEVPLMVYLLVVSLFVGILVTGFLSRLFFDPIKKLRQAMGRVAEGDFTTKLYSKSNSLEIQDIYSGFNLMTDELQSMEVLQTDFVSNVSQP